MYMVSLLAVSAEQVANPFFTIISSEYIMLLLSEILKQEPLVSHAFDLLI